MGRRHGLLPLRSRRRRERLGVRHRSKKLAQVTKFTDFDVKTLDAGAGAVVFEQAGYIHELDPKSGKSQVVNITARRRLSVDDAALGGRHEPHDQHRALADRQARRRRSARRDLHDPGREGRRPQPDELERIGRARAGVVAGRQVRLVLQRQVRRVQAGTSRRRTAWRRRARSRSPKPTHYYTPSWSPDSKKLLFTDTNLKVWVLDVASGQAKVVGSDPWMVPQRTLNPVWSPDSKWVAYASRLNSLYHAIFVSNVETGETKQVTDGLADAMSAGVGRERQVSVVPRVDRLRPAVAVARHDVVRSRRRRSGCISRC